MRSTACRRTCICLALALPPAAAVLWRVAADRDALVSTPVYGRTRPTVEPIPSSILEPAARAVQQRLQRLQPRHPAPSAEAVRALERSVGLGPHPAGRESRPASPPSPRPAAPVEDRMPSPEQDRARLARRALRGRTAAGVQAPAPSELPPGFTSGAPGTTRSR